MKILFLSDTQTDRSNLQESDVMLKHLLAVADKVKPDLIVHLGDAKDGYDPISLVIVKWWVRAVKQIVVKGHRFIVLKGNHDRISQSVESVDWLDILAAAGAEVVSQPAITEYHGIKIAFLPFTPNAKQEIEWADALGGDVLLFHTAVAEGQANGFSGLGRTTEELHFDKYRACFGGHYHGYQQITANSWYVGSPFCHRWDEANERKGFLLADITKDVVTVKRFRSKIPGWYDAEWLEARQKNCKQCLGTGYECISPGSDGINSPGEAPSYEPCSKCQPEPGAYIRSRVPVATKKISLQLQAEEERLKGLYPQARLHVVPKMVETVGTEILLSGDTDREKVEQYVALTFPEQARFKPKVVVSFLVGVLKTTGPSPSHKQIVLSHVALRNVGPYQEADVNLDKQGLVLIQGENRDWGPGHSNGSGKSTLLSSIPIALYGRTLKGQTHDAWAMEGINKTARDTLHFTDEKGRKIEVERTRRPHGLFLRIDDEDMSTGITGTGKNQTQGEIEKLYTDFQTFVNSVYIDQTVANGFLFGTQKDRMDLISKIVAVERFELGLKKVVQQLARSVSQMAECSTLATQAGEALVHREQELASLEQLVESSCAIKVTTAREELHQLQLEHAAVAALAQTYKELEEETDSQTAAVQDINVKMAVVKNQLATAEAGKLKAKWTATNAPPAANQPRPSAWNGSRSSKVPARVCQRISTDLSTTNPQSLRRSRRRVKSSQNTSTSSATWSISSPSPERCWNMPRKGPRRKRQKTHS
jgi:DNA repair exonuclease SbcCD nuclease subunit